MSTRYLNTYMLAIFTSAPGFGGKLLLSKNIARDMKPDLVTLVVKISVQTKSNQTGTNLSTGALPSPAPGS